MILDNNNNNNNNNKHLVRHTLYMELCEMTYWSDRCTMQPPVTGCSESVGRCTYSVAIAALLLLTLTGRSAFSSRNYSNETFDVLVVQIVN